jgi:uncharacterized membrane protein
MQKTFRSDLSGKEYPETEKVAAATIRKPILHFIQKSHPDFRADQFLARPELIFSREQYIAQYLTKRIGELGPEENAVLRAVAGKKSIAEQVANEPEDQPSVGQRVADKVATFGGSWTFILFFGFFIMVWITANVLWLGNPGFDPYPFILLNLILSCLAALQAPVIMMSQNRQEEKDRERGRNDYMVNLKSELEIRLLHEKIDHMHEMLQQELATMREHFSTTAIK